MCLCWMKDFFLLLLLLLPEGFFYYLVSLNALQSRCNHPRLVSETGFLVLCFWTLLLLIITRSYLLGQSWFFGAVGSYLDLVFIYLHFQEGYV